MTSRVSGEFLRGGEGMKKIGGQTEWRKSGAETLSGVGMSVVE